MKKVLVVLLVVSMFLLGACEGLQSPPTQVAPIAEQTQAPAEEKQPVESTVVEETPPAVEAPEVSGKVTVQYAKNFSLEYGDGYKVLTVSQPWIGATQAYRYVLIPHGAEAPANIGEALVVETPIDSIVTMSTTYYPFLEQIGKLETISAVDSVMFTVNQTVRTLVESGVVAEVGGGSSMAAVDVEKLIDIEPDVVMTSATGSADYDVHPKLQEAGLPVVINADYIEQDPLARAEWGKFIAAFYNEEDKAAAAFDEVVARYSTAKALAEGVQEKATVFVNTDYQGTWYVPQSESYLAILLKDAGADYLFTDQAGAGSAPLSFEVVFDRAKDADFWVNPGFAADKAGLQAMDERYAQFEAFSNDKVYNNNARANENGGLDYYESGVANPDVVLLDLVKIFYPDLAADHQLYYYQQLQ